MSQGTVGLSPRPILRENKVTLYRLHPNEFGRVMVMPNLPNGLHEAESYRNKGYKKDPQDLMPKGEVVRNDEGEIFLVPEGYNLISRVEDTLFSDNVTKVKIKSWYVVRKEEEDLIVNEQPEGKFICPKCGRECASELGLNSHMRAHKT